MLEAKFGDDPIGKSGDNPIGKYDICSTIVYAASLNIQIDFFIIFTIY